MMNRFTSIILSLLVFSSLNSSAQLFKRMHAKMDEPAPKAILIQLFTYQNRAKYLEKQDSKFLLETLQRDRDSVMTKMIADFEDHFSYCPKYYYIDTNYKKVLNKDFEGVLLDKDLNPVRNPVINKNDKDYFIVFFGNAQKGTTDIEDVATVTTSKHKLVVCDDKLNKLNKPLPDGSNNRWPGKVGYQLEEYRYESAKFDISYRPFAAHFNAKLHDFYGYYPYKK